MAIQHQFIRYATVGLVSNLTLYLAYLGLTALGVGAKLAMTLVYITGVCLTFVFNRNWTFKHKGHLPKAFVGYISIYVIGYFIQLLGLYIFVDKFGYPHELIMAMLIVIVAVILFLLQKTIVFKTESIVNNESASNVTKYEDSI